MIPVLLPEWNQMIDRFGGMWNARRGGRGGGGGGGGVLGI